MDDTQSTVVSLSTMHHGDALSLLFTERSSIDVSVSEQVRVSFCYIFPYLSLKANSLCKQALREYQQIQ